MIRKTQHRGVYRKESEMNTPQQSKDINEIIRAIDMFSGEMKRKMIANYHKGYRGWKCNTKRFTRQNAEFSLHAKAGDVFFGGEYWQAVDVANFAMMVWRKTSKEAK